MFEKMEILQNMRMVLPCAKEGIEFLPLSSSSESRGSFRSQEHGSLT